MRFGGFGLAETAKSKIILPSLAGAGAGAGVIRATLTALYLPSCHLGATMLYLPLSKAQHAVWGAA